MHRIAENLEALRGQTFRNSEGETFTTSFSAGVAELSIDGDDLSELYRAADEALYRAKAAGRSRVLPAGPALTRTGSTSPWSRPRAWTGPSR